MSFSTSFSAVAIDPTTTELAGFANLEDAVEWIGMSEQVLAALRETVSGFRLMREVALVPRAPWDAAAGAARVPVAGGAEEPTPPARPLRALELGQVESLREIARLPRGLPAEEEGHGGCCDAGRHGDRRGTRGGARPGVSVWPRYWPSDGLQCGARGSSSRAKSNGRH